MPRPTRIILLLLMTLLATPAGAHRGEHELALSGYDVVSYFTRATAEQGSEALTYIHEGREYRFISDEQRQMFIGAPDRYLPQYDGYCAYGVTFGKKLDASPEAWKIVDGKLYLNLNRDFLEDWSKDIAGNIAEGNDQWELIRDVPPGELQ